MTELPWWRAIVRNMSSLDWAYVELRAKTAEDARLKLRQLIKVGVLISQVKEV